MRTADFDYELPPELIAQRPAPQRDQSRLMVLNRATGAIAHRSFPDLLEYLRPGDLLALNDSRVIPARLRGVNSRTGGQFEVLLLEENQLNDWWVMLRPGKRARIGTRIQFRQADGQPAPISAVVTETNAEGHRRLRFDGTSSLMNELDALGEVPLPPYITRPGPQSLSADWERYQTVFARAEGSFAAPTAGLHFTEPLLARIKALGVEVAFVTLHVGLGTFAPVKAQVLTAHVMHEERYEISDPVACSINQARGAGRRVIAVGTTSLRVLESVAATAGGHIQAGTGRTRLFLYPPSRFQVVHALLTNFHLPCSTLLMLVSAFAAPGETHGRAIILAAYTEAIRARYRFFSYGDAMLIL